jgi:hydroxymethylbilane synthase
LTLRIGTRGSVLALAQARWVADRLGQKAELVPIATSGDRGPGGDKSRFVKEIERALLAGEVDLAVHSAKDVPSELPDGLSIVGVPERADPRDALCGAAALDELPEGATVGTSSLRRRAQLLALRPDLDVRDLRGNVDTRLRKLADGDYDALLLATAGLERLGRGGDGVPIAASDLVPAPGQGCLALEARSDDERAGAAAGRVTDRSALARLTAERALVAELDASCRTPVGAHAEPVAQDGLRLSAFVGLPDGGHWIRDSFQGSREAPSELGSEVGRRLMSAGARELLQEAERLGAPS